MLLLAREQGELIYDPERSMDQYHLALAGYDGGLLRSLPIVMQMRPQRERSYALDADLPASMDPIRGELAPPLPAAAIPVNPYADHAERQLARWQLKTKVRPWTEGMDDTPYHQYEDPFFTNLKGYIRRFGEQIITEIIERTATPVASAIGGIAANLAGWTNTTPALNEGYNAAVATLQTLAGGQVWGVGGDPVLLDQLIWRTRSGGMRLIIVPERFVAAMKRAFYANNNQVPWTFFTPESAFSPIPIEAGGIQARAIAWQGAMIVPLSDDIFTAAGHTVTGANPDYDIYCISLPTNADDGCYIGIHDEVARDEEGMPLSDDAVAEGDSIGVTDGMTLHNKGYINTDAGSARAKVYELSMRLNFQVAHPQAAAILTNVTD